MVMRYGFRAQKSKKYRAIHAAAEALVAEIESHQGSLCAYIRMGSYAMTLCANVPADIIAESVMALRAHASSGKLRGRYAEQFFLRDIKERCYRKNQATGIKTWDAMLPTQRKAG